MSDSIGLVLERLKKWTKYPAYKLEQRIDVFLSFFLREILETVKFTGIEDHKVFPEFPIKISEHNARSNRVDFMCISNEKIVLVEMKTSQDSIDSYDEDNQSKQISAYKSNQFKKWGDLKKHLMDAANKSWQDVKYTELIKAIDDLKINDDLISRVVYIVPEKSELLNEFEQIELFSVINILEKIQGPKKEFAVLLADLLKAQIEFQKSLVSRNAINTKEKKYKCSKCGINITDLSRLLRHLKGMKINGGHELSDDDADEEVKKTLK